jgi:hypothetical protein
MEVAMSPRTVFLCRLIGLYLVLVALAMLVNARASFLAINGLMNSGPMIFLLGVITIPAGVAMVLCHNVWTGGAAPVIVTLIGWITLLKGLLYLCLPPQTIASLFGELHYDAFFFVISLVALVAGVYLAWVGFRADSHHPAA